MRLVVSCKTSSRITCDRKTNGEELPDRTFEEAGKLAAYYSSMRGSEKVEIDYIEKKHIKKPKGAKPGFVVYYTNYSLVIDSDIRGIQKYPAVRISKGVSILSARLFTVKTSQGVKHAENTDTCLTPFIVLNSVP